MKLGFNLSIARKTLAEVQAEVKEYYAVSNEAIELSLTDLVGLLEFPFKEIYGDLKKFKYISLHLPVITGDDPNNKEFLTYPNIKLNPYLEVLKQIAKDIHINTYVMHPDQVLDFNWAKDEFGDLLGFENMDNRKPFGKVTADMKTVFDMCPNAKWIFDINHLYTNDNSMESSKQFYDTFRSRLTHYHISAFGGFHSSFTKNPHELVILKGVYDLEHPLIHEGYKYKDDNIKEEYELIRKSLEE